MMKRIKSFFERIRLLYWSKKIDKLENKYIDSLSLVPSKRH